MLNRHLIAIGLSAALLSVPAHAQGPVEIPPSLLTPDKVETSIGTLEFDDGRPNEATLQTVYDKLDFNHAFRAFTDTMQGVSMEAIRKGLNDFGAKDNEVVVSDDLLGAETLMLTANADTVYVFSFLDLSEGPIVLEVPPGVLGAVDDYWQRWIIDTCGPGPDRGMGGKYLIVPPGYDGDLPEGGFYIAQSRTNYALWFARAFLNDKSDPKPASESIRKFTKIYPYEPGGQGTSIAQFLSGDATLGKLEAPPPPPCSTTAAARR